MSEEEKKPTETFSKRTLSEIQSIDEDWPRIRKALASLARRHPILTAILCLILIAFVYDYFFGLRSKLANKSDKLDKSELRVRQLETDLQTANTELAPFKTAAVLKYGEGDKESLKKLATHISQISEELAKEKQTIRSFTASVVQEYSGTWTNDPPNAGTRSYVSPLTLLVLQSTEDPTKPAIILNSQHGVGMYEKSIYRIKSDATIGVGNVPAGELTRTLTNYDSINIRSQLMPKQLNKSQAVLTSVSVTFFVNGGTWSSLQKSNINGLSQFSFQDQLFSTITNKEALVEKSRIALK
jgi:hypothetical protein